MIFYLLINFSHKIQTHPEVEQNPHARTHTNAQRALDYFMWNRSQMMTDLWMKVSYLLVRILGTKRWRKRYEHGDRHVDESDVWKKRVYYTIINVPNEKILFYCANVREANRSVSASELRAQIIHHNNNNHHFHIEAIIPFQFVVALLNLSSFPFPAYEIAIGENHFLKVDNYIVCAYTFKEV